MTDQPYQGALSQETDWDQVFEAISDPMAILTPDYRVVRANAAYLAWQNTTRERCEGAACFAHSASGADPCENCPLPQTLASGEPRFSRMVAAETGAVPAARVYETWTYPVHNADGQVVRVVEIIKDVTDREQLARVTHEAETLREADQLKSELLGTVSHELRSPLASIKGYAATLVKHEQRLSAAERHEFLQAIVDASDRLEDVIDHMLEMSQLESGTLRLAHSPVTLDHLAREALSVAAADAEIRTPGRYTFAFETQVTEPGARGCIVLGDARRLRDVLDQMLGNAVKYTPQGGKISVTLRPATLTSGEVAAQTEPDVAAVDLVVRDAGIGIPAEHINRVFDRFHRVDTRLTREADGLGLGLAIARRVVELHGGKIWVESTPGSGSAFHVVLPLAGVEDIDEDEIEGEAGARRDGRGAGANPAASEGNEGLVPVAGTGPVR